MIQKDPKSGLKLKERQKISGTQEEKHVFFLKNICFEQTQ